MSAWRAIVVLTLVVELSGCATSVATLNGVVVGERLATGAEVGRVSVIRSDEPEPTRLGMPLQKGDSIVTGPDAQALLVFQEEWEVALDAGAAIYVSNPRAWLKRGRIFVKKLVERVRETFEVEDEFRVAAAEGTEFMMESDGAGSVSISVLEGTVSVGPKDGDWEPVVYGPLEQGHLAPDSPPQRMPSLTPAQADELRSFTLRLEEITVLLVPDLTGLTLQEAEATLARTGLVAGDVGESRSGTVPAGTVVGQEPPQGARARAGAEVDLVVEAPSARVPSLRGLTQDAAVRELDRLALEVGSIRPVETTEVPPGTIVGQSIDPQSLVEPGTRVDLQVAVEPAVAVPRLEGMTLERARAALAEAGLGLGRVVEQATPGARAGIVVAQRPSPGSRVAAGSVVQLTVAATPTACVVPRLVGRTEPAARQLLAEAGLSVGEIQRLRYPPRDQVTTQRVAGGQRVACGTAIGFTLGTIGRAGPDAARRPGSMHISRAIPRRGAR